MLSVLATGTLVSDPKSRLSANGKSYATASMRVPAEDGEPMLISIITFNADSVAGVLAGLAGGTFRHECLNVRSCALPLFRQLRLWSPRALMR